MKKTFAIGSVLAATVVTGAYAATTVLTAAPTESWTVTNYYKQAVYDPKESKIGDIDDVLVDKSGKITGLVIGVGGFLGVGEKDVIVPFTAVKTAKKNDKWWLTRAPVGRSRCATTASRSPRTSIHAGPVRPAVAARAAWPPRRPDDTGHPPLYRPHLMSDAFVQPLNALVAQMLEARRRRRIRRTACSDVSHYLIKRFLLIHDASLFFGASHYSIRGRGDCGNGRCP
jgi:sporulation protein YlmC with PRC-barrel domain